MNDNSADLSNLIISHGTLTPSFSPANTMYTVTVASVISAIDITPTSEDPLASITVNKEAVNSSSPKTVSLDYGSNAIIISVTSVEKIENSYAITVTRESTSLSSNADLSGLLISDGTLDPIFNSGTTAYASSTTLDSITVTPTVEDLDATVTVNGGDPLVPVSLDLGLNGITVTVTAADGTTKSYSILVTRSEALSSNADLSGLSISDGTLDPVFGSLTTEYTSSTALDSITVTPTVEDLDATVTVNDGDPAGPVSLDPGENTITVTVTAADGVTTKSYSILVTRTVSTLSSLVFDSGVVFRPPVVIPDFSSDVYDYAAELDACDDTLYLTPTSTNPEDSITIDGTPVPSGESYVAASGVEIGPSVSIQVVVGSTEYNITLTRSPQSDPPHSCPGG